VNDVPDNVRESLRTRLWKEADKLNWLRLSTTEKTKQYEAWVRNAEIGGTLARFINLSDVRVYIKDTLIKDYARDRLSDESLPFRILKVSPEDVRRSFHSPHGRELKNGQVIVWGRSGDWKSILLSAFERVHGRKDSVIHAVILTNAMGKFKQETMRSMVEAAGNALGVKQIVWLD
jgi:hypothetical protein